MEENRSNISRMSVSQSDSLVLIIGKNFFWVFEFVEYLCVPKKLFPKFLFTLKRPRSLRGYLSQMIWLRSSSQKSVPQVHFLFGKWYNWLLLLRYQTSCLTYFIKFIRITHSVFTPYLKTNFQMRLLCREVTKSSLWRLSTRRSKIRASNWTPISIFARGVIPVFLGTLGATEFFSNVKNDSDWDTTFELSKFFYVWFTVIIFVKWMSKLLKSKKMPAIIKAARPDFFVPNHWQICVDRVHFSSFPVWISSTFSHKTITSWTSNLTSLAILSYFLERNLLKIDKILTAENFQLRFSAWEQQKR